MRPPTQPAVASDSAAATPEAVSPASWTCSSSPSHDAPAPAPPARTKATAARAASGLKRNGQPKKKKIRTYSRRKAEMAELTLELKDLEEKCRRASELADTARKYREIRDCEEHNRSLRAAIHSQRLQLANTTSIISEFMRAQDYNPFDTFIRLGRDPAERRAAMLAIKPHKLQAAVHFLHEHRRFMDPTAEFVESTRFKAPNGDVCSVHFEVVPFPGAVSVQRAFDTLQQFVHSMEISVSEVLGDITVRENDDDGFDNLVTQHRFVTSVSDVVFLDTNCITFAEYTPASAGSDAGSDLGAIVVEYVDEDELYPYRPAERLRQDITILTMIASYPQRGGERVLAITRWSMFRFHHSPSIPLPPAVAQRVLSGFALVGDAMMASVRQAVV